jgi:hypothetical protein
MEYLKIVSPLDLAVVKNLNLELALILVLLLDLKLEELIAS